jgi:DNA-binding transcriptional regulator YiaG
MDALALVYVRAATRSGAARRVRLASGLTKIEIARSIGKSHACVSRWEDGLRVPQGEAAVKYWRLLQRLAAATGTSLDDGEDQAS